MRHWSWTFSPISRPSVAIVLGPEWRFLKQLVQEKQGDTSVKYLCASEGSRQEPQATKHFGDTLLPWLYPNSLILQIFPFRKCHSTHAHFWACSRPPPPPRWAACQP